MLGKVQVLEFHRSISLIRPGAAVLPQDVLRDRVLVHASGHAAQYTRYCFMVGDEPHPSNGNKMSDTSHKLIDTGSLQHIGSRLSNIHILLL